MKKLLALLLLLTAPLDAGLISHSDYSSGATITAAGQNANENAVFNLVNGQLDTTNLSASAGIVGGQIANGTVALGNLTTSVQNSINNAAVLNSTSAWTAGQTFVSSVTHSGAVVFSSGVVDVNGSLGKLNQVLVSTGNQGGNGTSNSVAWTNAVRVGAYQLVSVSTVSNAANVTFSGLNGIYASEFVIVLSTVSPITANNALHMQISQSGSFITSGYSYSSLSQFHGGAYNSDGAESQSDWIVSRGATDVGNSANNAIDGEIHLYAPQSSLSGPRRFTADLVYLPNTSSTISRLISSGMTTGTTAVAVDQVKLYFGSGNIATGVFYLYAIIGLPNGF